MRPGGECSSTEASPLSHAKKEEVQRSALPANGQAFKPRQQQGATGPLVRGCIDRNASECAEVRTESGTYAEQEQR